MNILKIISFILLLFIVLQARESEEAAVLRREIALYREKSRALEKEFEELESAALKDEKNRQSVKKKQSSTEQLLKNDIDKLRSELARIRKENRKLERKSAAIQREITRSNRDEQLLLEMLGGECKKLGQFLVALPPYVSDRAEVSLRFLQSELKNGTLGSAEGIERLLTIYRGVTVDSETRDVWQGRSPIDSVQGGFYYLRLGFFYLAVISEEGDAGYLYSSDEWKAIRDESDLRSLFHAVQTALGNRTPELSTIPVQIPPFSEGGDHD